MSSALERIRKRTGTSNERARILQLRDEDADEVLDALATDTRRRIYRALFDDPSTQSELADRLDTSVQNVQYHLSSLDDVGLVEPVDTVYSEKGNEMIVYGPASDPIVFVGDDERFPRVQQSLTDIVAGLGLLALASLFVQWGFERHVDDRTSTIDNVGPASYESTGSTSPEQFTWFVVDVVGPGLLFFAGCLLVATVVLLGVRR